MKPELIAALQRLGNQTKPHTTGRALSTFRTGGDVALLCCPTTLVCLVETLRLLSERGIPHHLLGAGSNTLVADGGYDGVVLSTKLLTSATVFGNCLHIDVGARLPALARLAKQHGLQGLEPLHQIPATLGGAIVMNAGAYGTTISDLVATVTVYDKATGQTKTLAKHEVLWGYRNQHKPFANLVVLAATLLLAPGNPLDIHNKMVALAKLRCATQPNLPSLGSVFVKPPSGLSAGHYIDRAGLKGKTLGGAAISHVHANFIVNLGGATSNQFVMLMQTAMAEVKNLFDIQLVPEITFLGTQNKIT